MKPIITIVRSNGSFVEWVDAMPEAEVFAYLPDYLIVPRASRLPGKIHLAAVDLLEELSHIRDILIGLPELRGTLKKYRSRIERVSRSKCSFPAFPNDICRFEESRLFRFFFR